MLLSFQKRTVVNVVAVPSVFYVSLSWSGDVKRLVCQSMRNCPKLSVKALTLTLSSVSSLPTLTLTLRHHRNLINAELNVELNELNLKL